jgi:sugar phosphate isomerase/epimerase
MPRLSMNEMTTYRWSFEEDVANYRAAGFSAIGVWRRKLSDFGEERGIELLQDSGLAVSNLSWAGGFTGSEGHTYQESLDDAAEAIRLAGAMNACSLIIYSGARAGHTHNHARRLLVTALGKLAPLAEEHRVTLALEPVHVACAKDCTFVTSLDGAYDIVRQIDCPNVKLSIDTYHMGMSQGTLDLLQALAAGGHIAVIHLADGHPPDDDQRRTRLGKGCVPLAEVSAALRDGGYDGDYDIELFGDEVAPDDYQSLLTESKQFFDRMVGVATTGGCGR